MKKNQGLAAIFPLILLLIGLVLALVLVGKQTIFNNHAAQSNETTGLPTYKTCKNFACVIVQGVGRDSCRANSDCVPTGINVTAEFTATPISGPSPLTVQFTNQSVDGTGNPSSIISLWDFGDGSKPTYDTNPKHVFNSTVPKDFKVTLKATNINMNQSESISKTITITPPAKLNPITWKTKTVSVTADDFYIKINGVKYVGKSDPRTTFSIRSDPGSKTYTTLEVIWKENQREMRLFSYYSADKTQWWIPEVRTYNGQLPGDWIYYSTNPSLKYKLGQMLTGTFTVPSKPGSKIAGEIYFKNLKLQTFFGK